MSTTDSSILFLRSRCSISCRSGGRKRGYGAPSNKRDDYAVATTRRRRQRRRSTRAASHRVVHWRARDGACRDETAVVSERTPSRRPFWMAAATDHCSGRVWRSVESRVAAIRFLCTDSHAARSTAAASLASASSRRFAACATASRRSLTTTTSGGSATTAGRVGRQTGGGDLASKWMPGAEGAC